ncbi:hypothetical protein O181_073534 [Austropuccinia psidii MF-1]|uniref:Uncharacterized protein n=1 Tax=Austropuccinia psidii MF-1 TaxID=1389203 RepID=A0A9Q3F6V9_9BASI|nr:hypothetical protein [Austropuccinia psidii MF-1]
MPVRHIPPANNRRSRKNKAVLTPPARIPFDCTPSVHQMNQNLDRGPSMDVSAPYRRGGMNSRTSRLFSGLLSSYHGISQWPRSRFGEAQYELREKYVEGEET